MSAENVWTRGEGAGNALFKHSGDYETRHVIDKLLHAHDRQPLTRSETVEIPEDVTCVVIRGHDRTHEYGDRLLVVNLESGATRSVDQGTDPRTVDESDCPCREINPRVAEAVTRGLRRFVVEEP